MASTITVTMTDQLGQEPDTSFYSAWLTTDAAGAVTVKSELNVAGIVQFTDLEDDTYYLWVTARNRDRVPIAGQAIVVSGGDEAVTVVLRYYPYNATWGASLADFGGINGGFLDHVTLVYHTNEGGHNLIAGPMNAEGDDVNGGAVYSPCIWKSIGNDPNVMWRQQIYNIGGTPIVEVSRPVATYLT